MERLFNFVFQKILNYSSIDERLGLKLINKKLKNEIDELNFKTLIIYDYNLFLENLASKLPADFDKIFSNIILLSDENFRNTDKILNSSSTCFNNNRLSIEYRKEFEQKLSANKIKPSTVSILHIHCKFWQLSYYDFLFEFPYLQRLKISSKSLPFGLIKNCFEKCQNLKSFLFFNDKQRIEINLENNIYKLMIEKSSYDCKTFSDVCRMLRKKRIC